MEFNEEVSYSIEAITAVEPLVIVLVSLALVEPDFTEFISTLIEERIIRVSYGLGISVVFLDELVDVWLRTYELSCWYF